MPELSRFYGIVIQMYNKDSDHNPPHLHAKYGDYAAAISIKTGDIIDGFLPLKVQSLVKKWVSIHREELMNIWNTQVFKHVEPLE